MLIRVSGKSACENAKSGVLYQVSSQYLLYNERTK